MTSEGAELLARRSVGAQLSCDENGVTLLLHGMRVLAMEV